MIAFLEGTLVESHPTQIVIDVRGVGYDVIIPLSSFDRLPPPGGQIKVLTHLSIREDAHILYGFTSTAERDLFRLLIQTVSGIGPKIALNVLSGMTPIAFKGAIASQDIKALTRLPGLGKKTAERIIVELKDKIGKTADWEAKSAGLAPTEGEEKLNDAISALVALGYKQPDALKRAQGAQVMLGQTAPVDQLVRAALQQGA